MRYSEKKIYGKFFCQQEKNHKKYGIIRFQRLDGEKPVKEFSSRERGKNKSIYCRQKLLWDVISDLIRAGYTSDTANDKVYQVYGRGTSVTSILVVIVS